MSTSSATFRQQSMAAKIEPQLILEAAILIRRATCPTAMPLMTAGIAALGPEAVARIVKTIPVYDDFCHANDAYEEHDFGSFEADGQLIFFKIDLYEEPNVKDANGEPLVNRVLTIMLAEEY
jgi:uncharacterized protein DUF3768